MNAHLANDIGNLLNRTLNLLHKFCGGTIPHDSAGQLSCSDYQAHSCSPSWLELLYCLAALWNAVSA